ncbi:1-acyl-sn-glycerol-3-phosphate acyltransferase [Candidatus Kaiserbacteria bacterium]|nr:MAG: 1-acyl-sn-glycerol-3-phosphate acyltransferase [Candidatus Kaiserbacteria bacterium]
MSQFSSFSIRKIQLLTPSLLQGFAWPFGRFAVHFFTHLTIEGKENIKKASHYRKQNDVGTIFVVNHTHELDFLFPLVGVSPLSSLFPMFYVAHARKKYSEKTGFGLRRYIYSFPAFLTSWGAHPYIADQKDYSKSMPYHEILLRNKKSVCIFPEGGIRKEGADRKIRGGVAYLAEATGAAILPIAISGAKGMNSRSFFKREKMITIKYLPPLFIKDIEDTTLPIPERYKDSAKKLMNIIEQKVKTN